MAFVVRVGYTASGGERHLATTSSSDRADLSVAVEPSTSDYMALWWRGEVRATEAELIAWARRERLLPLLGWRAEVEGWTLPAELEAAIQRRRRLVAVGQILADEQLKALGATAVGLGIPVVLVKGAAAAAAYPAPWMRPYGDIDVLVDESDGPCFMEAARGLGYDQAAGTEGMRAWHYPRMAPASLGLALEVHTALARDQGRAQFTMAQWRDGLYPMETYPGLWAPHPVDHVLYLIHHALVHHEMEMGVQSLADVRFATQDWTTDDWDALHEKAEGLELERAAELILALCAWFWNAPWPAAANHFAAPPAALLTEIKETVAGTRSQSRLPHIWRDAPSRDLKGMLLYARTILLGDPEQLRDLPLRQRVRFHTRRPGELLHYHGTSLWRLLKGDPSARAAWHAQRELQAWLRGEER